MQLHGFPLDMVSVQGPQFVSNFWNTFCNLVGATVSLSSGYHPQSNGQSERLNQELEKGLRCLVSQTPAQWSKNLLGIEFAHDTLPSVSTKMSSFQCVYGYQPPLFSALEREVGVPAAAALVRRCRRTWVKVRQALLWTSSLYKTVADLHRTKGTYLVGQ